MKKWWYWTLPIAWMGVIFYSSSQPYEQQDLKPTLNRWIDFSFLEPIAKHIRFTYHHSEVSVETLGINGLVEFFIRKAPPFRCIFRPSCTVCGGILQNNKFAYKTDADYFNCSYDLLCSF
ncbi:VanZ family protein [Salinibacillus xinjiangensis]|uniref:hypothetical protein n=1 Tax=Salinibacillus xinjiangensis TaxID=1229268 RepID=UPI001E33945F|nr:hypothetical protein [Salinibacillus xinjiangensis]